jgi:SAM-dependent methyltransferase
VDQLKLMAEVLFTCMKHEPPYLMEPTTEVRLSPQVGPEPCAVCGHTRAEPVYRHCRNRRAGLPGRFDLLRCQGCGIVFLSPQPPPRMLSAVYAEEYHSHAATAAPSGRLFKAMRALCLLPYRLRFGHEGGTFPPFGQGRLLDVGCGTGDYLSAMAALGWQCCGCDISGPAVTVARRRVPHAKIYRGTLDGLPWGRDSFEAVSLWHTFEHVQDPVGTLKRIRDLLVPGGRLVVAVPNIDSLEARALGGRWAEIDIPGHLFFFSVQTLRALLGRAGFAGLRLRPQVHPSTVSDALGFLLDDLLGIERSCQRRWLYYMLFPLTAASYALGNWGCIEVVASK